MPSSLFTLLDRVMLRDESLQFTISRGADHALTVLLQPILKTETQKVSDEVESIRAALAGPLYLSLPATELDARFEDLVGTYAAARAELSGSYHGMVCAIRDADKAAKAQTASARRPTASSSVTSSAGAKPSAPKKATAETASTQVPSTDATASAAPAARAAEPSKQPDQFSLLAS